MNGTTGQVDLAVRLAVRDYVAQLLSRGPRDPYVVQVERVLCRFLTGGRRLPRGIEGPGDIRGANDVVRVFKFASATAGRLVDALKDRGYAEDHAKALSVCFAACAHPNQAHRMADGNELSERVDAFLGPYRLGLPIRGVLTGRLRRLPREIPAVLDALKAKLAELKARRAEAPAPAAGADEEADEQEKGNPEKIRSQIEAIGRAGPEIPGLAGAPGMLLRDLCAAGRASPGDGERERIDGAILYLLTCRWRDLAVIAGTWPGQRELVRFLRDKLMSPPSSVLQTPRASAEGLAHAMGEHADFRCASLETRMAAAKLEIAAIFVARDHHVHETRLDDEVAKFWGGIVPDGLASGFPAYAFRSQFSVLWRSAAEHYKWRNKKEVQPGPDGLKKTPDNKAQSPAGVLVAKAKTEIDAERLRWILNPEFLRICREGYRLIRTTFFWTNASRKAEGEQGKQVSEAERARRTIVYRRAADEVWHYRVAHQLHMEDEDAGLSEIVRSHPDYREYVGWARLNNATDQIKVRLGAYVWARWHGLSASVILRKQPEGEALPAPDRLWSILPPEKRPSPFTGKPGAIRPVATLARAVPKERTLLWAVACRVFLHPRFVDRAHGDPWDLRRFIAELWWWLTDPLFCPTVQRGAQAGGSPDEPAARIADEEPFETILCDLRQIRAVYTPEGRFDVRATWAAVDAYADGDDFSSKLGQAQAYLSKALLGFFEARDWSFCAKQEFDGYLRLPAGAGERRRGKGKGVSVPGYWIVPAWYLVMVDKCDLAAAMRRLAPDGAQREKVKQLVERLIARRESLGAPGIETNGRGTGQGNTNHGI